MQALDDLLAEVDGDVSSPDVQSAVEAWFAEAEKNIEAKVDGYAGYIAFRRAQAAARKAEARRISDLARADELAADHLCERLKEFFETRGLKKLETPLHVVSVRANGGALPVIIADGAPPADGFERVTVDWDKKAVLAALTAGQEVPGARLGERGTSLQIR
jgi:hypothetical protein